LVELDIKEEIPMNPPKEGQNDPRSKNQTIDGFDSNEVYTFLRCAAPQLDKEYQDLLSDFLINISKNMSGRNKINEKDFLLVMDSITLRESEKSLNPKEMTQVNDFE
jgi:hypothetical protein